MNHYSILGSGLDAVTKLVDTVLQTTGQLYDTILRLIGSKEVSTSLLILILDDLLSIGEVLLHVVIDGVHSQGRIHLARETGNQTIDKLLLIE